MSQSGGNSSSGGSGGSGVQTLTSQSGVATESSNNINIVGSGLISTSASGATLTISESAASYPITPYVVGPVGKAGYQTIQSALTAAGTSGSAQLVYVMPGSYTESLTFPNVAITLAGDRGLNTTITGVHTPSSTAALELHQLLLVSATDILNSAAAGAVSIEVSECFIVITNGYVFNLPNWTGELLMDDSGEASTNDGVVNNTGGATIKFLNTEMGAGSANTMTLTGNGNVRFDTCNINCPMNIAGSGTFIFQNGTEIKNSVTIGGSKTGAMYQTDIISGSSTALTWNSSGTGLLSSVNINSSANPCVAGSGSGVLSLADITYIDNATIAGTVTTSSNAQYPVHRSVTVDVTSGAGVNPTLPTPGGALTITGGQYPSGTFGTRVMTIVAPSANTLQVEAQISATSATSLSTKNGLCHFNSAEFSVDANGFVSTIGGGVGWVDVTGATQTLAVDTGYVTDHVDVTYTLPSTANLGASIQIVGKTGIATITPNANQQILIGSASGTVGATGTAVANNAGDCISLICVTAGTSTVWRAQSMMGTWTLS